MSDELSNEFESEIEKILRKKFPEENPDLARLRDKIFKRLEERLPYFLTAVVLEVILSTIGELEKLGMSKPCKHFLPDSRFCLKGKECGSGYFNCEDYEPMETQSE